MRRNSSAPGLSLVIPFALPAYWEANEALTVYELVNDLYSVIWTHYQLCLADLIPEDRQPSIDDYVNTTIDNPAAFVDLAIPADWTAEEALAVFGLLDRLRSQIWTIYRSDIRYMVRRRRRADRGPKITLPDDDLPF